MAKELARLADQLGEPLDRCGVNARGPANIRDQLLRLDDRVERGVETGE